MAAKKQETIIDYRAGHVPEWVRRAIDEQFAIEAEDARQAGTLGYMTRALVLATMPYKDPKADVFTRVNGDFKLRILAGYEGGIPYGIYPRLLMSWVATEAVRNQSPVIELGDSLRQFLRDVLELRAGARRAWNVHPRCRADEAPLWFAHHRADDTRSCWRSWLRFAQCADR